MTITLADIQGAAKKLEGIILPTPTIESRWLGDHINGRVFLKLENMQMTGSFKPRGAYIRMHQLTPKQREQGVIAMSAGNHAQGVAYHAKQMGIRAIIVMPKNTPFAKVESTSRFQPEILLEGDSLTEAAEFAQKMAEEKGLTLIHPYDDPAIIAGQGTVALEIMNAVEDLDAMIVPIGGGGLAAGMCVAMKALKPQIKIYGVQSAYCPAMHEAIYPERKIRQESIAGSPLAEGIAVKSAGMVTREILKEHLEDIFLVNESQIEEAVEVLLMRVKTLSEGAGASGVAALYANASLFQGQKVGILVCGGNIDSRILSSLVLRGLVRQSKLCRLKIEINDAPGILGKVSHIIGHAGGNIYEVNHQRLFNNITAKMAIMDLVVETRDRTHLLEIVDTLKSQGFPTIIQE